MVSIEITDHMVADQIYMSKNPNYCATSNLSRTIAGNKIIDHWDVVGASPVGAAPTLYLASMVWAKATARREEKHFRFGI